jgi:hypothetical protein
MARRLALVNGIPKMIDEVTPYEEYIDIVASGATGNQLVGPISAGTFITLPASKIISSGGGELNVYVNGSKMTAIEDYDVESTTQVSFTFELIVGDRIQFDIERDA